MLFIFQFFPLHAVAQSNCNLPKDPSDLRCASIILCLDSRRMGFNCFKFKCCITNCETCKWRPYFLQLVYLTCVKLYHFLCKLYQTFDGNYSVVLITYKLFLSFLINQQDTDIGGKTKIFVVELEPMEKSSQKDTAKCI